jgi:hypothetical protein
MVYCFPLEYETFHSSKPDLTVLAKFSALIS